MKTEPVEGRVIDMKDKHQRRAGKQASYPGTAAFTNRWPPIGRSAQLSLGRGASGVRWRWGFQSLALFSTWVPPYLACDKVPVCTCNQTAKSPKLGSPLEAALALSLFLSAPFSTGGLADAPFPSVSNLASGGGKSRGHGGDGRLLPVSRPPALCLAILRDAWNAQPGGPAVRDGQLPSCSHAPSPHRRDEYDAIQKRHGMAYSMAHGMAMTGEDRRVTPREALIWAIRGICMSGR